MLTRELLSCLHNPNQLPTKNEYFKSKDNVSEFIFTLYEQSLSDNVSQLYKSGLTKHDMKTTKCRTFNASSFVSKYTLQTKKKKNKK